MLIRTYLSFLVFLTFFCFPIKGEENFVFINGNTSQVIREFGPSIYERVTPASTFKIALSLIGYDAKILKDEVTPNWNYQEGYDDFLMSWKSSHVPKTWMEHSCIWFSKIIALHLGLEKFQKYLSLLDYGNQDLSAGMVEPGPLNPAWVSSSLKISPKEQVDFIQKMVLEILPVSSHAFKMTKSILFKEELADGWKLYGKTGLGSIVKENSENLQVRWFVGWIENDHTFFPFAYQMRARSIDVNQAASRILQLLEELKNDWLGA